MFGAATRRQTPVTTLGRPEDGQAASYHGEIFEGAWRFAVFRSPNTSKFCQLLSCVGIFWSHGWDWLGIATIVDLQPFRETGHSLDTEMCRDVPRCAESPAPGLQRFPGERPGVARGEDAALGERNLVQPSAATIAASCVTLRDKSWCQAEAGSNQ